MDMKLMEQALTLLDLAGPPLKVEIEKCEQDPDYDPNPAVLELVDRVALVVVLPPEPTRRVLVALCDGLAGKLEERPATAEGV